MARLGIIFGLILFGISIAAMLQTPLKAPSQFYSMMFGIPTFFCGIVALNPHRRRQAMIIASGIAGLGASSGSVWVLLHLSRTHESIAAGNVSPVPPIVAMTFTCVIFLGSTWIGFSNLKKRATSNKTSQS